MSIGNVEKQVLDKLSDNRDSLSEKSRNKLADLKSDIETKATDAFSCANLDGLSFDVTSPDFDFGKEVFDFLNTPANRFDALNRLLNLEKHASPSMKELFVQIYSAKMKIDVSSRLKFKNAPCVVAGNGNNFDVRFKNQSDEAAYRSARGAEKPNSSDSKESKDGLTMDQKLAAIKKTQLGSIMKFMKYDDAKFKDILNGKDIFGVVLFGLFGNKDLVKDHYKGVTNLLPDFMKGWFSKTEKKLTNSKLGNKEAQRAQIDKYPVVENSGFMKMIEKNNLAKNGFKLREKFSLKDSQLGLNVPSGSRIVVPSGASVRLIENGRPVVKNASENMLTLGGGNDSKEYVFVGNLPAGTVFDGEIKVI